MDRMCWFILSLMLLWSGNTFSAWPPSAPENIWVDVPNVSDYARTNELVSASIPVPRSNQLLAVSSVRVVDEAMQVLPTSARVLARWQSDAADSQAPIKWILVRFPASVPAQTTRRFRIVLDASAPNPAPAQAIVRTETPTEIEIDTGAGYFVISRTSGQLSGAALANNTSMVSGSIVRANIDGVNGTNTTLRRISFEQLDSLVAVLVVEYTFDHPAVGGGAISGGRRMIFSAGSGSVSVREWIDWEGAECSLGMIVCNDAAHARRLDRWQLDLTTPFVQSPTFAYQANATAGLQASQSVPGSGISLHQMRRADRLAAQRFELRSGAVVLANGIRADAPTLMVRHDAGTLAISLENMADYEPQSLGFNGLAAQISFADNSVWLGHYQGSSANYRFGIYPPATSSTDILADQLGALQSPLLGLPELAWLGASGAVDEFPIEAPSRDPLLARFDDELVQTMESTIELRRQKGLMGLQTFGLYPRYWGSPVLSDEIDCGFDPTPAQQWDNSYWCATWTDYHNTTAIANVAAWRLRNPTWLHSIGTPAALRSLHTQMLRCSPDNPLFYCGQFPAGYGGYRADFNSSHQYIENLVAYYWRTGDSTVPERLRQGARSFRGYLCPSRGGLSPGAVCSPNDPIGDAFANLNDRVANQFYEMFHFLGTTIDASFLDDWQSNTARGLTQNFALVRAPVTGQTLGFLEPSGQGDLSIITGPGRYRTTQLWMAALYDFNQLHRLDVATGDAPLGMPAIAPSEAIGSFARSLRQIANTPPGNGTASGIWPNAVNFAFTGNRVGGDLTELSPEWSPGSMPMPCLDSCLYPEGKAILSATLMRAANESGDPALRSLGLALMDQALDELTPAATPLGKSQGEYLGRLASGLAYVVSEGFADGFE